MNAAEDVVWGGTVDSNKFTVKVVAPPNDSSQGQLTVTLNETQEVLLNKEVRIAYGAIFGADIADVAEWEAESIGVIDQWYRDHGQTPPADE